MTNTPQCQFGAIDPSLIIRSLTAVSSLSGVDDGRALRVRPIVHTDRDAVLVKAITCASKEDLEINIRRSLWLSCDGRLSLNVYYLLKGCEENTGSAIPCAYAADIPELFNHMFVEITYDDGGIEYALAIVAILDNINVTFDVDDDAGLPIANATITITSDRTGDETVLTTNAGGLADTILPQGGYTFEVVAALYTTETGAFTLVREDEDVEVNMNDAP